MTARRRPRRTETLPPTGQVIAEARQIARDLRTILVGYARLEQMGAEPRREGERAHVSGSQKVRPDGSVTGSVPEVAVSSAYHESRRSYARWLLVEIRRVADVTSKAAASVEANVYSAGYRQPESISSDAIVGPDEFDEARRKQGERLKAGNE